MPLLTCQNLYLGYEGKAAAQDISFTVNAGDYLCIVGENGSGKTTLMRGILGLLKPMSGSIALGEGLLPTQIGYLPQQTSHQRDFPASVKEVVLSGRLNARGLRPFYTQEDKKIAYENMEKLGILPLQHTSFKALSGGQQQRVLLSRALCATSKMLLLDEPVSGLDPLVTVELYRTIQDLSKNITIIMISHDVHAAAKYASHILHMRTKQIFFGTPDEYVQSNIGRTYIVGGE